MHPGDIDRWRLRITAIAAALAVCGVGLTGCGGADYSGDNEALARPLLANAQVITALGSEDTEYCSSGSCTLGSDGLATTYVVSISAEFEQVIAAFRAAYPGFAVGSDLCEDPTCVEKYVVWATRADDSIELAYDDNLSGLLTVDSHTAVPTTSPPTAP